MEIVGEYRHWKCDCGKTAELYTLHEAFGVFGSGKMLDTDINKFKDNNWVVT